MRFCCYLCIIGIGCFDCWLRCALYWLLLLLFAGFGGFGCLVVRIACLCLVGLLFPVVGFCVVLLCRRFAFGIGLLLGGWSCVGGFVFGLHDCDTYVDLRLGLLLRLMFLVWWFCGCLLVILLYCCLIAVRFEVTLLNSVGLLVSLLCYVCDLLCCLWLSC